MPATPLAAQVLTAQVLTALRRVGCPVTTTDLMRLLNRDRATPLVVDQVYRAANALRVRGEVRRLRVEANKRVRYWEYVKGRAVCTCQNSGLDRPPADDPTTAITGPAQRRVRYRRSVPGISFAARRSPEPLGLTCGEAVGGAAPGRIPARQPRRHPVGASHLRQRRSRCNGRELASGRWHLRPRLRGRFARSDNVGRWASACCDVANTPT